MSDVTGHIDYTVITKRMVTAATAIKEAKEAFARLPPEQQKNYGRDSRWRNEKRSSN